MVLGLAVRIAILSQTSELRTRIVDEQQYSQIARNIVAGNGFASAPGTLTSIRPPLYPGVLATVWLASGSENLQAVRVVQILMALLATALVYALGARVYGAPAGRWAAAIYWLYPSFIFFNFLVLTETLFTLLLVAFVLLAVVLVQGARTPIAAACGLSLGLAALTRSILWPVPLVLCPLLFVLIRGSRSRRLGLALLVFAGYAAVVAPWAIRNSRLQGVLTIVDTMGGMNLRMGNYEFTPDDRMWDAVSLTGEKSWIRGLSSDRPDLPMTEGRKEKWAQRKALEYMREHPGVTLRRSVIKFADFWGIEREFIAGLQNGFYAPPQWFQIAGSAAIVLAYVLVVITGTAGIWLAAPEDRRMQIVLLLPVVVIMGAHSIVFGHSRYHLPLIPIFAIYSAAVLERRAVAIRSSPRPVLLGATVSITILLAVWVRQIAIVDLPRIAALLSHGG
jgi:4-amino-4-deoxy-L-arabinose transferase-like glycosyltransferase